MLNISIHALREEGDDRGHQLLTTINISIHALREEGDAKWKADESKLQISIHALREEGDPRASGPARKKSNFYPRPPRGGRHALLSCL